MGKFDFNFDADLTKQLKKLANFDEVAEKVLNESVPILERHVKSEAKKHKRTGDLVDSIKKTGAKEDKYGWYVTVRPTGTDRNGIRNMEKLVYSEYGTSKQPPIPILTKALNDAESEVTDKMQEIFNREVSK